jgi:hypothetical protein
LKSISAAVAQPEFFEQWANFACVRKKLWAKWAGFLLMGQTKYKRRKRNQKS